MSMEFIERHVLGLSKKSTNVRSELRRGQWIEKQLKSCFSHAAPLAPGLTALAAEKLFFHAQRFPAPERERAILATGHRLTFEVSSPEGMIRLACWSWGDGPTVFLLHGWSGRGGQLGAFVEPLYRAGYSVIAFDAPAHGESSGKQASAVGFAHALSQVVARFGPAHAVVAHSMGGWSAAYAALEGTQIERIVLIGSPTDPSIFTEAFAKRFGLTSQVATRLWERAEKRFGVEREAFALTKRIDWTAAQGLIIHDRGDDEVAFSEAEAWARSWPGSRLLATEGLGHRKILRDSAVIEEVLKFVGGPGAS